MKNLLIFAVFGMISSIAQAQICDDPIRQSEVCTKMRHMRAQVNALDAQRDLMQVNYPYIKALADGISQTSKEIVAIIKMDNPQHVEGIKNVNSLAESMSLSASQKDPNALTVANLVRVQCIACHSNEAPSSGIKWDKVFKNDWDSIVKKCNMPGRNPYLCKSMNGMLSAYGYFITSNIAGIQNYDMSEKASAEILRILGELKKNNVLHMSEEFRANAENIASEINKLAAAKDPEVFTKSLELPQACMKCHESRDVNMNSRFSAVGEPGADWLRKAIN